MCPRWVLKMQVTTWQELCACVFWCSQPCTGHHHSPPTGPFRVMFANWLGFLSPTDSKQHTHTHTCIFTNILFRWVCLNSSDTHKHTMMSPLHCAFVRVIDNPIQPVCVCVYPHWIQFSFNEYKSRGSSERLFPFSSAQSSVRLCLKRNMEMGEREQNNYF